MKTPSIVSGSPSVTVLHKQLQAVPADALIVPVLENAALSGAAAAIDTALGGSDGVFGEGAISQLMHLGDFKGRLNEIAVIYSHNLIPAPRVILVGLGKPDELTADRVRAASGTAVRKARDLNCKQVACSVFGENAPEAINIADAAQATIEGALLGMYQFREHKTKPEATKRIEAMALVESHADNVLAVTAGARAGEAIATATNFARDLISRAPNVLHPAALANHAQTMAQRVGLHCTVMTEKDIAELGMGGILAVAQGSAQPPRFVVLDHNPPFANANLQPLVFVGKGVTFDTGGISIKPAENMQAMKGDMAGAAAVLGALQAIAELNVPRRVIGLVPMVENMPSDRAYRPGDVITMMSGLTVEIISTDAEGRMILADALHYAKRYAPAGVVDLATLTGACVIALGEGVAAGLFSNSSGWAAQVLAAAEQAGEKLWQLPLYPEYGEKIRSDFAEIKNSGGRTGGVGTSAYFLKRFVEDGKRDAYVWAHIDMAGMAFSSETKGWQPKSATGYGVRTLVALSLKS